MRRSPETLGAFGLSWLALAAVVAAQQPRVAATPTEQAARGRTFSGRVVDGLGRPVPAVDLRVLTTPRGRPKAIETALRTGDDGRFTGVIPTNDGDAVISFARDGYAAFSTIAPSGREFTLRRKANWDDVPSLPDLEGDEAVRGVREALASEDWERADDRILGFFFTSQDALRPAIRRLVGDPHVGADARDWLELLGDPGDRDLLPKARRYEPKEEVKQADLVEALKATARQRNAFSSAPEPMIAIDFIALTKDLDRALIQCGINRVAMTGITWQFVFRKVGPRWELRSAKKAGQS